MLNCVELSADVLKICLQHALATESEEIMGLLIGEVNDDSTKVKISAPLILRRYDKKPDRVEISDEQLVQASYIAEQLTHTAKKPLRVVGWYHSHPHITVWPSHVDLRTQAMYQRMDSSFVGLIFAVFLTEQFTKAHEIQVTCFQSSNNLTMQVRREIPLTIISPDPALTSTCLEALIGIPKIFEEEENETFTNETAGMECDFLTKQHNEAVRTIALGHIAEKITSPLLDVMTERNRCNTVRLKYLYQYKRNLLKKMKECGLI